MVLSKELSELLEFLSKRKDYAIFSGFGAFLHTGVKASADIDIFVPSFKIVNEITKLLVSKGWKKILRKTDKKYYLLSTLKKNNMSLDIVYSVTSKTALYPMKEKLKYFGWNLSVLSKEAMFITKLNQLTQLNRKEEKYK